MSLSHDHAIDGGLPHPLDGCTEEQRRQYDRLVDLSRGSSPSFPSFPWLTPAQQAAAEAKFWGVTEDLLEWNDDVICGAIDVLRDHGEDDLASDVAKLRFGEARGVA